MAEQYAILCIGQSQGNRVGELTKFENQMPQTAVRNAGVFANSALVSRAFQQDRFTLPGNWPAKYASFSLRGRATSAVLRLTPYNPVASYYEQQDVGSGATYAGHVTTSYPGYAEAQDGQETRNRTQVDLRVAFQADPSGLELYRVSTGTSHTIASGWANTAPGSVFLTDPLDPPLQANEVFKLPLQVTATGTTTTIPSNVRFGGYHDGGSQFEAAYGAGAGAAAPNTIDGFSVQPYPVTFPTVATSQPLAIQVTARYFRPGQRVQFTHSGGAHPGLPVSTDFWVTRVDYTNPGSPRVFVSTTRFGAEVTYGGTGAAGTVYINHMPQHVDSTMAGCRVRWLTGAMAGETYDLTDNTLVSSTPTDNFHLTTLTAMSSAPQAGDTFEIIPQRVNNEDVAWDEFMHFVPECYMPGQAYGQATPLVATITATSGTAASFAAATTTVYEGMRFRMFDFYVLPTATVSACPSTGSFTGPGQILYVVNLNYATGTFQVSTSYNGSPISDATFSGIVALFIDEHPDRSNPMPPGFNSDNAGAVPLTYQPYFGSNPNLTNGERGANYITSLATAMHEHLGRPIHVIHHNIGGTSLARREVYPVGSGAGHSWFDSATLLDWSPNGEPDNCYARMSKMLTAAKRAAAARGDTLKIVGVFNPQGETDCTVPSFLERYPQNIRTLIRSVRDLIVSLGMWDGDAEQIPWWQPQLPTTVGADWGQDSYATNIAFNTILTDLAEEDPYFVTRALTDAVIGYDGIHYRGDYLYTLGLHAFDDWKTIANTVDDRTKLDICKQALKNVGETREIASLTENSTAAQLCRRYYPVAERTLLEQFPWPEATKFKQLTQTTNTRDGVDWQYAYTLPVNFLSAVTLTGDPAGVHVADETEFTIEGAILYTNISEVYLRYTATGVDPANYSQHLTNALTYQLAAEIAPGLAQGDKGAALQQSMLQMAQFFVGKAEQHAAMRQRTADHEDKRYAWD